MTDPSTHVLFSGDWHAGTEHARRTIDLAAAMGIERVVQVGDFGYWPRFEKGREFLELTSQHAISRGVSIWFCDGNHEDHDALPHDDGGDPVELAPSIRWVPRGTVVEWHGRRILFFGGAVSVDQDSRINGWTWFANEVPSPSAWQRAQDAGQVDVVVAHDTVPEMPVQGLPTLAIPWSARRRASDHRKKLRSLCQELSPSWWIHGHWHDRSSARLWGTRFESLGHDRGPFESTHLTLDLSTLEPVLPESGSNG
jgi:hypothetical protein